MLALYVDTQSLLHRLPTSWKMVFVLAAGIGVFWISDPLVLVSMLCLSLLLPPIGRLGVRRFALRMAPFAVLFLIFFLIHGWLTDVGTGLIVVCRFGIMVVLALVLSMTTRVFDLIGALERGLGPLRHVGVDPERVALVLAMTIRFVPMIADSHRDIAAAQKARGVDGHWLSVLVPLLVRLLQRADAIGDALTARGVGEHD